MKNEGGIVSEKEKEFEKQRASFLNHQKRCLICLAFKKEPEKIKEKTNVEIPATNQKRNRRSRV